MSLINDVLRDLDSRRAGDLARPDLQREIRALPAVSRTSISGVLALALVVLVLVAGTAWHFLSPLLAQKAPSISEAVVAPVQPALLPVSGDLATAPPRSEPPLQSATSLSAPPAEVEATAAVSPVRAEREPIVRPKIEAVAVAIPAVKSAPVEARSTGSVEKKLVLTTPRDRAEADLHTAQALLAQERSSEAADSLRSALRHDPAYSPARQLWLKLLLEQKRFDEVLNVLQDGLELQPNQIGWAMTLARLKLEKNDALGAERVLAASFGFAAGNPAYFGFYGHVRSRLGQSREAIDLYQAATRLAPGEGRWWFGLAAALESSGRAGEAREAYRQAQGSGNLPPELASIVEQRLGR